MAGYLASAPAGKYSGARLKGAGTDRSRTRSSAETKSFDDCVRVRRVHVCIRRRSAAHRRIQQQDTAARRRQIEMPI